MLSKLTNIYKEFGAVDGSLYLIHRVMSRLSARLDIIYYDLVAQPVPDEPIVAPRACRKVEMRELHPSDPTLAQLPIPEPVIAARFAQGSVCYAAFREDKFLGYGWLCYARYEEDEIRVDYELPGSDSAFDFDVYIFPDYRLGRGFVCLWEGLNAKMRERGVTHTYSRISRFNTQSVRSHAQLGANPVGRLLAVKLFSVQIVVTSCRPRLQLLAAKNSRMSLRLPGAGQARHT